MTKFIVDPVIGGGGIAATTVPSASTVGAGTMVWDSTVSSSGGLSVSDGTSYIPLTPIRILAQSAIPVILPSSGTLSAAGALSGITALQGTYPSCWLLLPANAVATSSAAGLYFAQMSSTTAGTVFQNTITSGAPTIPTASQLIPCTTASNYTSITGSNLTALTIPIPANAMGPNGILKLTYGFGNNNSANTKAANATFGGSALVGGASNTTNLYSPVEKTICNRGVTNSQVVSTSAGFTAAATTATLLSIDTTAVVNLVMQLELLTAATDTCQYEFFCIEIYPQ